MRSRSLCLWAAALLALGAPRAAADTLFFKDGRFFDVPKVVPREGGFDVVFDHGTVFVAGDLVRDYYTESDGAAPTSSNPEDRAKIEKGLVPFEGKWIPKARRERILEKRREERRKRLEEYRSHQEWRNRYTQATKHFTFEYTVPPEVADHFMELFEAYFDTFAKVWRIRQPKGKKLRVCFYNNQTDFLRIGNVPPGVLGYFRFVEPIELNFFYARRDERLSLDVLFHELNHYLFHLYTKGNIQFAPWLEEGMAEYYGASSWDPKSRKMVVGNVQEGRLINLIDEMDGDNYQDLQALMNEANINAIQYAWSWSLCHMLMESQEYRPRFVKFVQKLASGKLPLEPNPRNMNFQWTPPAVVVEQFQKTLKIDDLDAFEQRWYDYIRGLEIQSARGYHQAALFCVRWDRPVRAGLYFKRAIDDYYSKNPDTYLEYGKLLNAQDRPDEAVEVLEKGIRLDPLNARLWHALGRAHRKIGDAKHREEGKRCLLVAIDIDPYDPDLLRDLDPDVLAEIEG